VGLVEVGLLEVLVVVLLEVPEVDEGLDDVDVAGLVVVEVEGLGDAVEADVLGPDFG